MKDRGACWVPAGGFWARWLAPSRHRPQTRNSPGREVWILGPGKTRRNGAGVGGWGSQPRPYVPPPKVALGNGCPSAGGTCPPWPRPRDLGGEVKPEGSRGEEARREGKERGRGSQGVRDGRAHPQTHLPRGAGKRGRWLSSSVAALAQRSPALPCGDRGPEEPEKSPEG